MDRKHNQSPEILSLLARSSAARSVLQSEASRLRQRLDVPGRVRDSIKSRLSSWLVGSTAVGLAAGLIFPRFRRSSHTSSRPASASKSTPMRLLGLALSAASPFVKAWLTNQLRSWLTQRAMSATSPTPTPKQPR